MSRQATVRQLRPEQADELYYFRDRDHLRWEMSQAPTGGITPSEAGKLILEYGASRCEAALLKTRFVHSRRPKGLRSPVGWLINTLAKGLEWTREDVEWFKEAEREQAIEEARASRDMQRMRELGLDPYQELGLATPPQWKDRSQPA
ncbi:MAG TPA: hypothetical protein VNL15_06210 [Dehalococcoidia bacterium]|nr:hypothetical protein [Dehalococcoidia bacterium]